MTVAFEQVVDTVMELPYEQQEMLKELISKWHVEARRMEIARDVKDSLALFHAGQLQPQSAQSIINQLRQSLIEEE